MLIKFNIGFYESGIFVSRRRRIMSRYFRFSFIIDIIGMIIIINDFIGSSYDLSIYVLNFLVFLKIYDVLKVNR